MNADEIERARKLCEKATPGPWYWSCDSRYHEHAQHLDKSNDCYDFKEGRVALMHGFDKGHVVTYWAAHAEDAGVAVSDQDSAFIAASRQLVPALLDELEQARAALAGLVAESDCSFYPDVGGAPKCTDATTDRSKWCAWCIAAASLANRAGDGGQPKESDHA